MSLFLSSYLKKQKNQAGLAKNKKLEALKRGTGGGLPLARAGSALKSNSQFE